MPMIAGLGALSEARPGSGHAMSVVEAHRPLARRLVQGEGIGQAVRASLVGLDPPDPELEPITRFEMVDTPVEGKKKFKLVFRVRTFHILAGYLSSDNLLSSPSFDDRPQSAASASAWRGAGQTKRQRDPAL